MFTERRDFLVLLTLNILRVFLAVVTSGLAVARVKMKGYAGAGLGGGATKACAI